MAMLSALKRLARLSGWIGLSAATLLTSTCASMFSSGCESSTSHTTDAGPDAVSALEQDAAVSEARGEDAAANTDAGAEGPSVDANKADLWNVICE
jgi:hypothetical protein